MFAFLILCVPSLVAAVIWLPSRPSHAQPRAVAMATFVVTTTVTQSSGRYASAGLSAALIWLVVGQLAATSGVDPLKQSAPARRTKVVAWSAAAWFVTLTINGWYFHHTWPWNRIVFVAPPVILVACMVSRMSLRQHRILARGIVGVAAFQSAFGAYLFATQQRGPWVPAEDVDRDNPLPLMQGATRVMGTMQHPIPYALFLTAALLLVVSNATAWNWRRRLLAGAVIFGGVYLSGSRSAFLAGAVGIAVFALQGVDLRRWFKNLVGLAVLFFVGRLVIGGSVSEVSSDLTGSASYLQRQSSIDSISKLIGRHGLEAWFGTGFGDIKILYDRGWLYTPYDFRQVDNWFVYVLGTTGIVGVSIFAIIWVTMFVRVSRLGRAQIALFTSYFVVFDTFIWSAMLFLFFMLVAMDSPATKRYIQRLTRRDSRESEDKLPAGATS